MSKVIDEVIHFTADEGALVRSALERYAELHSNDGGAWHSFAGRMQTLASLMEQANQPGDYGHWELRWCANEE